DQPGAWLRESQRRPDQPLRAAPGRGDLGHYGLVVDYLAEVFREFRKETYADAINAHFRLGAALNRRDEKAVRKTVSGLLKLIHPDGRWSREDLEEYLRLALEMRKRVKEQLRRMGGVEYWNTHFSYLDGVGGEERFVEVPEQATGGLISQELRPAGVVYTVGLDVETGRNALFRIEVGLMKGGGKLNVTGAVGRAMREAIKTAHDYLKVNLSRFAADRSLEDYDVHVQVVNLMQAKEGSHTGAAFFVALLSALVERSVKAGTVILGEMTIQGSVLPVDTLSECLQLVKENGGGRVLIPTANAKDLPSIPGEMLGGLEIAFFSDAKECLLKALAG
ncbi:MAG: ATP-dependent Lon protease, partial [candidate division NC10 bacterium]|nr:ATP-dependent Lon protease [candidate division NC10 bacterium]